MTVRPQCFRCKHLEVGPGSMACPAFPAGIPDPILLNEHDHREPFEGDHGIRFEPIAADTSALEPVKADRAGRLNFTADAMRRFVADTIRHLAEKFGHTYKG